MLVAEPFSVVSLAKMAAKPAATLVLGKVKAKFTDKKIKQIFHEAFGNEDYHAVLALCADKEFCNLLFEVAEGKIVDAEKLSSRGLIVAEGNNLKITALEIDKQLRSLALDLEERFRSQKGGATVGSQGVAFSRFSEQMDGRYNTHLKPTPQTPLPQKTKNKFYLAHSRNPNLCHAEKWIAEIRKTLQAEKSAAVSQGVLVGEGGIGKTAMGVEYAHECRSDYPGGVYWLEVDQGIELPLRNLLPRLGLHPSPEYDAERLIAIFVDHLNNIKEQKLLILDNLEDAALPTRFALSNGHLLVTTRNQKINLPKIDMVLPTDDEALDILLGYSKYKIADLSGKQKEIARSLCRRCGNLPLALEILGTMLTSFGFEHIANLTDDLLDETENVTSKKAQITIRQVLAVTEKEYRHPRAMEALVYATYLHPDNIDENLLAEAMEIDQSEAIKACSALAEWSVVKRLECGGYTCHRLIQESARDNDPQGECGNKMSDVLSLQIDSATTSGDYVSGQSLIPHLQHIAKMAETSLPVAHFPQNETLSRWASILRKFGLYPIANEIAKHVLERNKEILGLDHPSTLNSMGNLAATLLAQGDLAGARSLQEHALEALQRILGEEHPDTLNSMNNLAQTRNAQGDLVGARSLQEHVLEAQQRILGEEHPSTLNSMNNLAATLMGQGDLAGARALQEHVLEAQQRILGEEHPSTLTSMSNLAITLKRQGVLAGARSLQERAFEARRRLLGEEHPSTLTSMNNLASTHLDQGDLVGARSLQEHVLEARRRLLGEEHPNTLNSMNNLGSTLLAQGDLVGARSLQEHVLETRRRLLGEEHPDTLFVQRNLKVIEDSIDN